MLLDRIVFTNVTKSDFSIFFLSVCVPLVFSSRCRNTSGSVDKIQMNYCQNCQMRDRTSSARATIICRQQRQTLYTTVRVVKNSIHHYMFTTLVSEEAFEIVVCLGLYIILTFAMIRILFHVKLPLF